jgi:hypothetical protein
MTEKPVKVEQGNNVISLDDAFKNSRDVHLSEIADSVTFLSLETTNHNLLRNPKFIFSSHYIFAYSTIFDWTGKYRGTIGKKGNGPYEEPEGAVRILFKDNHFYSKGTKFIEYDMNGMPTGKVKRLYDGRKFNTNDILRAGIEFFVVGKYLAAYDYPATIYFFDDDFETVASRRVIGSDTVRPNWNYIGKNFITYYKDTTLFYNFINDTIFSVTEEGLEPRWIVNFDNEQRLSADVILRYPDMFIDMERTILGGNSLEKTEIVRFMDNKHIIGGAFETDRYIFFLMKEMIPLAVPRKKENPAPYVMLFDKVKKETVRVKGNGFIDDILEMNRFFPNSGVYDEKLIASIWPYEILDYIDECREEGRKINPRLFAFSKTIKPDDNPVLIFVHLKRSQR